MIKYLALFAESVALTAPYWVSLKLARRALGANAGLVGFIGTFLATLVANVLIVEISGPENIMLYHLAVITLCASALFWSMSKLFSKPGQTFRADRQDRAP